MFCENCGAELKKGSKFCVSCGSKVENTAQIKEETETEESNEEISNTEVHNEVKKLYTEKKKGSKLPLVLVILVILGIGAFYVYKTFFGGKANVVKGLVNGIYDQFEKIIDETNNYDLKKNSILVDGDFSIDSNISRLDELNDIKLKYTMGIDYKNKKMEVGGALTEDDKDVIDLMMYLSGNKSYISLKDIYKYLIVMDNQDVDFEQIFEASDSVIKTDDIKFIVKSYKDALLDSLDMNEFDESSDKIEINGKEVSVTKLQYELTVKSIDKLSRKIVKKLVKNKKFISKLAEILKVDEDDIKEGLESYLDTEEVEDSIELGKINIYVQGINNKFVGMDIKGENLTIKVRKNGNETNVELKSGDAKVTLDIIKENDESFKIKFKIGEVTGEVSVTEKKLDSKNISGKIEASVKVDGEKLGLISNYKIKIGGKIADIDIKNAKKTSEITQSELEEISNKLKTNLLNSKLYNLIASSMRQYQNYSNSYSDDYYKYYE